MTDDFTPTRRTMIGGAMALALPTLAEGALAQGPMTRGLTTRGATGDPVVDCPAGRFVGTRDHGVMAFRGIRYGTAQRFMAPRPVAPRRAAVTAQVVAPSCPQKGNDPGLTYGEDCLALNIWTAGAEARAPKPVMVYIHGGAYSNGSANLPRQAGDRLAARGDVVVVTVNHRLNALGYLYLARLDPRFADSGNLGQLDLILALQWVRANIAAFGGDPSRVMVFGQSGGGAKIATMMGMPAATGLFHRAATMSGQQVTASGPMNATQRTRAYLAKLGVADTDLAPLTTMPVARLIDALDATDPILGGGVYFGPVLDMTWLTRHPFWPDANPQGLSIPMMMGNTHDETRAFLPPDSAKVRGLKWANLADRIAPELRIDILPEWVVAQYRARYPRWSPTDIFYDATTCGRSWRGQVIEAEARATGGAPAYVYQVDYASRTDPDRRAFHSIDIALVFGTIDAPDAMTGAGPEARAASDAMQERFVAFAKTGDPNRRGMAPWPTYDLTRRSTMIFDAASRVEGDPRRWQRTLFARVPYIQPGT